MGWGGVEFHAAHGYLLSSFLSNYTNNRTDQYGGSVQNRARIVAEIMEQTRKLVGDDYIIMIKMNSSDSGDHECTQLIFFILHCFLYLKSIQVL